VALVVTVDGNGEGAVDGHYQKAFGAVVREAMTRPDSGHSESMKVASAKVRE